MSADWIYDDGGRAAAGYRGEAGDCAVRAAAIATGQPYKVMYDAINVAAAKERPRAGRKRSSARDGVWPRTLGAVLADHGFTWVPTMGIGTGCRVHLAASELPAGRLVVRVSKHYCAVVDGVVRDNHDPGRDGSRCVYGYWIAGRKDP